VLAVNLELDETGEGDDWASSSPAVIGSRAGVPPTVSPILGEPGIARLFGLDAGTSES
jgi:hypothetical protein